MNRKRKNAEIIFSLHWHQVRENGSEPEVFEPNQLILLQSLSPNLLSKASL